MLILFLESNLAGTAIMAFYELCDLIVNEYVSEVIFLGILLRYKI